MQERTGVVTMKGNPVTLIGPEIKVGDKAPNFIAVDQGLNQVTLKQYYGKVKVISSTPSLDTPVCDAQARRFNDEATKLGDDVVVINISMDLPFAIKRFCSSAGIDAVQTMSDHRDGDFGEKFGVTIKELRLLTRAVFVIDAEDVVRYVEIVPEATDHPNYDAAIEAVKKL